MATTKAKAPKKSKKNSAAANGTPETCEVLTLAEAAAYLRVSEEAIKRLVDEQDMPGRFVGDSWRFLKSALQTWLSTPMPKPSKEAVLAAIGNWENDPYLEQELKEIYKRRGRPMTEDDE